MLALLLVSCVFAGAAAAATPAHGVDGGIEWDISEDGTLTISAADTPETGYAKGEMKDYINSSSAPWMTSKSDLKTLVINDGVAKIGDLAFAWCTDFTGSLLLPSSLTTIGTQAFYSCSGFTGPLTIGNSVTTIGGQAFFQCSGFTGSLIIPDSVTTIGMRAFESCSGFTGVFIPAAVTTIGSDAFSGCTSLSIIYTAGNPALLDGNYPSEVQLAATNGGKITEFPAAPLLPSASQIVKEGSTFLGWKDSTGASVTEYVPKQTGVEGGKYFAQWSDTPAQKYTVTFDSNGGSAVSPAEVVSGSTRKSRL